MSCLSSPRAIPLVPPASADNGGPSISHRGGLDRNAPALVFLREVGRDRVRRAALQ